MSEPTDADRAKAAKVQRRLNYPVMLTSAGQVDVIADALASERSTAVADLRARVLALAEELDEPIQGGAADGMRPFYGGGDIAWRLHKLLNAVTDTTGGTR